MPEILIDSFSNSGSEYRFYRDEKGNFCISRDGKVVYKGFSMKGAQKQYNDFKRGVMRGGENG